MILPNRPKIKPFFDSATCTFSYLVSDPLTNKAAVIDSVLNFDYAAGKIQYDSANTIIAYVEEQGLEIEWHIETHVHADHLSASPYIQAKLGGKIAISELITEMQNTFGKFFNTGTEFARDGSQFDKLFADNEIYPIGTIQSKAIHTPGHTPLCMSHLIGDAVFVGDTLFMPDVGTARADFPGGDAKVLYQSIQKILSLPEDTRLFVCHDYIPEGRKNISYESTIREQKQKNIHVGKYANENKFVSMRNARDATLNMPDLIMPSIQVNMRAGHMPPTENNGTVYLKVPISGLKGS